MSVRPTLSVRSPRNIDEFVSGGRQAAPDAEPSAVVLLTSPEPPPAQVAPASTTIGTVRRPKMRGLVKRADGDEKARVTVYLELDAAARLRRHCFENGLELSEVAAEAIEALVTRL